MFHVTFNPGPSQLSDETKEDIKGAIDQNIGSLGHRGKDFSVFSKAAIDGLRAFHGIPDDHAILFTPSATEAMQLIAHNCIRKSFHFTCGAFSELFANISQACGRNVVIDDVPWGQMNQIASTTIPPDCDLIAVTANETSTGVMLPDADIAELRSSHPDALIALDSTSIAGMKPLNIADADLWYFSVQKGFGLPAGLGVLIVSPEAIDRAETMRMQNEVKTYFTFHRMLAKAREYQTICTPNVLAIYLLSCQLERWNRNGGVARIHQELREKQQLIDAYIASSGAVSHFVHEESVRSPSVICIQANPEHIEHVHQACVLKNIVLGKGYGKIQQTTFRIANFPAITKNNMEELIEILRSCEP